jgi:branched-chain amino acid transport system permease protein
METLTLTALFQQILIGLSRTTILFMVASGLTLVLGVLRIPNVFHGSLYMIGAFLMFTMAQSLGFGSLGFWVGLILAPLLVALVSIAIERGILRTLYEREHLMLLLFTFSISLVLSDAVKLVWGSQFRSMSVPPIFEGAVPILGMPFPRYNLFLLALGPFLALGLWILTNKTKIGKIARAASVDREMVDAIGINVSLVFASVFIIGCYLAGLGGALIAPMQNIVQGMDHNIIIEAFLIVIMGGLGNIWGALLGALIFGLSNSIGVLIWPQFSIVLPYLAVIIVLSFRPNGLLRSVW